MSVLICIFVLVALNQRGLYSFTTPSWVLLASGMSKVKDDLGDVLCIPSKST